MARIAKLGAACGCWSKLNDLIKRTALSVRDWWLLILKPGGRHQLFVTIGKFLAALVAVAGVVGVAVAIEAYCARQPDLVPTVESIEWHSGIDTPSLLDTLERLQRRYREVRDYWWIDELYEYVQRLSPVVVTSARQGVGANGSESYRDLLAELDKRISVFAAGDPLQQRVAVALQTLKEEVEASSQFDVLVAVVHIQNRSTAANALQTSAVLRIFQEASYSTPMLFEGESTRIEGIAGRRLEFRSGMTIHYADAIHDPEALFAFGVKDVHGNIWTTTWSPVAERRELERREQKEFDIALDEVLSHNYR